MKPTFAGIASLPGRPLEQVLQSLRPQVDELGVFLNGYDSVPEYVDELKCHWVLDKKNGGSSKKLHWAPWWEGYYFACDDDLLYPPDYVQCLALELKNWEAAIFATACGRTLKPDAQKWCDWIGEHRYIAAVPECRWINYLGGCAFAFDAHRLKLPAIEPPNEEEAVLSVWAQSQRVPIRLVARPFDWPKRIPLPWGSFTLYQVAARNGFKTRSGIIRQTPEWQIHQP